MDRSEQIIMLMFIVCLALAASIFNTIHLVMIGITIRDLQVKIDRRSK